MSPAKRKARREIAIAHERNHDWSKAARIWRSLGDNKRSSECRELAANNTTTVGFMARLTFIKNKFQKK